MRRLITALICCACLNSFGGNSASIAKYLNNCQGVWHYSFDDYNTNSVDAFIDAIIICRAMDLPVEIGVITGGCTDSEWERLQDQIDLGGVTVASHSTYHRDPDTYPEGNSTTLYTWDDLDYDVQQSFADIETHLTLPTRHRYNGENYCTSWLQPWGTAVGNVVEYHAHVRSNFYDLGVLNDRSGSKQDTNPENLVYALWDSTNTTFARFGVTSKWNTYDYDAQIGYHTLNIENGGTSGRYAHPYKHIWATEIPDATADPLYTNTANWGYYTYRTAKGMAEVDNTWRTTPTDLYQYRYLATQADTTLTCAEDTTGATIVFGVALAERERYGLSGPVTIVYTNDTAVASTSLNAYCRGQNDGFYRRIPEVKSTDSLNGVEGVWRDGDTFYISAALSQTGTNYTIKVATSLPNRFNPESGQKLLFKIP